MKDRGYVEVDPARGLDYALKKLKDTLDAAGLTAELRKRRFGCSRGAAKRAKHSRALARRRRFLRRRAAAEPPAPD